MFLGMIKYVLNNGLDDFRSDFAEYKKLDKECRSLRMLRQECYDSLYGEKGCIKQRMTTERVSVAVNNRDINLFEYYCESFSPCSNFLLRSCAEKNCPFYDKNKRYLEACEKYAVAEKSKKNFWSNKLVRSR